MADSHDWSNPSQALARNRVQNEANVKLTSLPGDTPYDIARDALLAEIASGSVGGAGSTFFGLTGMYEATAYGLVGDGATDDRAALNTLANTTIGSGGGTIFFKPTSGGYNLKSDVTIPANVVLDFPKGAFLTSDASDPIVVTILGPIRSPVFNHIFRGKVRVRLATTSDLGLNDRETGTDTVYPEWWGATGSGSGDDFTAIQRCIDAVLGYPFFDHVDRDQYTATSATAGPPGTITVSGAGWATDQWRGANITVSSGTGSGGTVYTVASNTATVATLTGAWSAGTPDNTSVFYFSLSDTAAPRNASARVQFGSAVYQVSRGPRCTNAWGLTLDGINPGSTEIRVNGGVAAATASSGTTTTITQTGAGWTANQWRGYWVVVNSGTNAGEHRYVTSSTSDTLTVSAAFSAACDNTTNYSVLPEALIDLDGAFTFQVSNLTLMPFSTHGVYLGVYYHRRSERTELGSSRGKFSNIWVNAASNPIFYAAWMLGARGHFSNYQEDNTHFENCWATGNWTSGYTGYGYKYGWVFGNGAYSNNVNHVGEQCHAISWENGFSFDATNVTLTGGSSDYCKYAFQFPTATSGNVTVRGFRCEEPVELIRYATDSGPSTDLATFEDIAVSGSNNIVYDSSLGCAPLVRWAAGGLTINRLTCPNTKRVASQTANSGTTTTLTKTAAGWSVNQYQGYLFLITTGTARGETVEIASNTSDTLTFSTALSTAPDATSVWNAWLPPTIYIGGGGEANLSQIAMVAPFNRAFKASTSGAHIKVSHYAAISDTTGGIEYTYGGTYTLGPPITGTLYQKSRFGFGATGSQPDTFIDRIGSGTLALSGFESLSGRFRAMGTSPTPTVTKGGTHSGGATTYNYKLVAIDPRTGGRALASAAGSVTNCLAALDTDNNVAVYPPIQSGGSFYAAFKYVVLKDVAGTYNRLAGCPSDGLTLDELYFFFDKGQGTFAYTLPTVDETGQLRVDGSIGFYGTAPVAKPTVTGSRGGNAALQSLLSALASQGLITDSSS